MLKRTLRSDNRLVETKWWKDSASTLALSAFALLLLSCHENRIWLAVTCNWRNFECSSACEIIEGNIAKRGEVLHRTVPHSSVACLNNNAVRCSVKGSALWKVDVIVLAYTHNGTPSFLYVLKLGSSYSSLTNTPRRKNT